MSKRISKIISESKLIVESFLESDGRSATQCKEKDLTSPGSGWPPVIPRLVRYNGTSFFHSLITREATNIPQFDTLVFRVRNEMHTIVLLKKKSCIFYQTEFIIYLRIFTRDKNASINEFQKSHFNH